MTISNELLSTTLHSIMKEETDQLFQSTPLLDQFRRLGGIEEDSYGIEVTEPIGMTSHSTPTAFPTGYETPNLTVRDVVDRFRFAPADIGQPIIITRKEEEENKGPKAIVKIAEARVKAALGAQRRTINSQALSGDEAVGIAAGLNTLYGHRAAATGFLEGRALASQVNVVGGQSKAQVQTGLHNQFQDVGDDFSANGVRAMNLLQIGCRTRSEFGSPNFILASEAAFANYKDTLFPGERWAPSDKLDAGRIEALRYAGAVMEPDIEMPTSGSDNFEASMYFLNTRAVYLAFWKGNNFDLGNFADMTDRPGRIAWLYTKLQLCVRSLSALGFLADGNTP